MKKRQWHRGSPFFRPTVSRWSQFMYGRWSTTYYTEDMEIADQLRAIKDMKEFAWYYQSKELIGVSFLANTDDSIAAGDAIVREFER